MTSLHERRAVAGSLAAALLCTLAWGSAVQAETQATVWSKGVTAPSAGGGPKDVEARVRSLLSQMSLEQKIGQMIQGEIKSVSPADVRTSGVRTERRRIHTKGRSSRDNGRLAGAG